MAPRSYLIMERWRNASGNILVKIFLKNKLDTQLVCRIVETEYPHIKTELNHLKIKAKNKLTVIFSKNKKIFN